MTASAHWPAVIVRSRRRIAATYALAVVELACETSYPWAVGVAIDGLLADRPRAMVPLVAIWVLHAAVGVARQAYDTRLFTRLYAEAVTEMIDRQGRSGTSTAVLAGRSALARELVDFFERDVPALLTAILGCVGSLALLTAYDARAGGVALLMLVPVALLNWHYSRRAVVLNEAINDAAEEEVDIIASGHRPAVVEHFRHLARLRVRLSDAEARTWGITELFSVATAIGALFLLTTPTPTSPGHIFAAMTYLFAFIYGLDAVPNAVERTIQAYDIAARLSSEDDQPQPRKAL
ncbi:ABC transporter six-transmembrane domain-containing protein [Embleya sp. NBC_00896]|uniref:ABC transporter six-transmembrane domain-containing protein n=1 Tax=Embleya sp. NBC_00896 TaxID=2975961 RepID=UPI002F909428|nr:ABC transporter six-transmembrane domain-containing protein [Embleya sp. NBC_00896]